MRCDVCRTQEAAKDAFSRSTAVLRSKGVFAFISHHGLMDQKGG